MGNTVLIVSQRERPDGFGRQPGYVSFTEAEDVLVASCDADLVMVDRSPTNVNLRARRLTGRALRHLPDTGPLSTISTPDRLLPSRRGKNATAGLRPHYDVAVFVGFTLWDLPLLERMQDVRRRADRIVVWIPEAWASEFDDDRLAYEPFTIADSIFIGMEAASKRLSDVCDRPVHHVPPAVDARRFAATSDDHRPIDVLGIGRRNERLHRGLLEWSRKSNKLYIYDTITGSRVADTTAHRENLADTYRRTNIAMTNFAKYDVPAVTGDERETPGRLWEGLASGSIMAGFPPDERLQTKLIGETVVVPLPSDPSESVDLLDEICRSDGSIQRRHQVHLALRGHDWIHRWQEIFERCDLAVPEGFSTRIDQLDSMANALT